MVSYSTWSRLLYVNKNKTHKIWPLLANGNTNKSDIKRLNHIGTHPVHTDLAISNSIDYLKWIGMERKENRMRFLQRYWSNKLRNVKNVIVNTPLILIEVAELGMLDSQI